MFYSILSIVSCCFRKQIDTYDFEFGNGYGLYDPIEKTSDFSPGTNGN